MNYKFVQGLTIVGFFLSIVYAFVSAKIDSKLADSYLEGIAFQKLITEQCNHNKDIFNPNYTYERCLEGFGPPGEMGK